MDHSHDLECPPRSLWLRQPWLRLFGIYVGYSAAAHLAWEVAQLPLYTLWQTAPATYLAFSVLHCTGGDLLIATVALFIALPVAGPSAWPPRRFAALTATAVAIGIGYTVFSEWLNVFVCGSWTYSEWMPLVPATGIGLSPILQWLIIPTSGLVFAGKWLGVLPQRSRRTESLSPGD